MCHKAASSLPVSSQVGLAAGHEQAAEVIFTSPRRGSATAQLAIMADEQQEQQDTPEPEPDARQRVKIYHLNGQEWNDHGTGHVQPDKVLSTQVLEVHSEDAGECRV